MNSNKNARRLTGYNSSYQSSSLYDDNMTDDYYDNFDHDNDEDDHDTSNDDDDDSNSVLSVPDPNIDFDMVYALHTFAATVDGQASVVKGDALTLLDDSNSYWWLVKVLKTSEVGYIPAENIETPYERLARLNSHRNIELTRRDIQDAFPVPPSSKAKSKKRVKLSKGVKFQSQVIFGGDSGDENDFAEEFDVWDETISLGDSDSSSNGSSDDDDYFNHHTSYDYDYTMINQGPPTAGPNAVHHPPRSQHDPASQQKGPPNGVPRIVTQPMGARSGDLESPASWSAGSSPRHAGGRSPHQQTNGMPLMREESSEPDTIKISLTPASARDSTLFDQRYYEQMDNGQSRSSQDQRPGAKLERLLSGEESPTSPKNNKKSGLRKLFSRNKDASSSSSQQQQQQQHQHQHQHQHNQHNQHQQQQHSPVSQGPSLEHHHPQQPHQRQQQDRSQQHPHHQHPSTQPQHQPQPYSYAQHQDNNDSSSMMSSPTDVYTPSISSPVHSLSSIGASSSIMVSPVSPSHVSSPLRNSYQPSLQQQSLPSMRPAHHEHHHHRPLQPHALTPPSTEAPTTLMIHAGNFIFPDGQPKSAQAYTSTNTLELIEQIMASMGQEPSEAINYSLIVKGVDGDEYTLVPSDQPVTIYQSLTGHLNMPMPSLKKARRISQLMSTGDGDAHIGRPRHQDKEDMDDQPAVRFYLHHKRKQVQADEMLRIKVTLLASEMPDQTHLFSSGLPRLDKSLSVPLHGSVGDVAALILERFHVLNGVVDGSPELEDRIEALRLDGDHSPAFFRLIVVQYGQERTLHVNDPITKAFEGEPLPTVLSTRSSHPDRSSIASMSSVIQSPQPDETYFIVRRVQQPLAQALPTAPPPQRPSRTHRPPVRQNTPLPNQHVAPEQQDRDMTSSLSPPPPLPQHLQQQQQAPTMEAMDAPLPAPTSQPPPPPHQQSQQRSDDDHGDVLWKLDQELDHLAHTRNSNDMLTEAVTQYQQRHQHHDVDQVPLQDKLRLEQEMLLREQEQLRIQEEHLRQQQERIKIQRDQLQQQESATAALHFIDHQPSHERSPLSPEPVEHTLPPRADSSSPIDHHFQQSTPAPKSSKRRDSIQSILYWDDFGMEELMIMIRGSARCQEVLQRRDNERRSKRASKHYTAPIRNEINEVFKETYSQIEQLEKELDVLMAQALNVYGN
ncbi:hypothetical protein DM01DRAFT_1386118 [Hesseltinella vesiculosa]|uniref:SH3 domain-containing protein n=1 Tax=Hesseltinella vesiculosa TaxID=101127 RepID=A0A1X2G738_9FUNG|nr:hypothetical protein DM01DRAFT_1386118 [Hesseltinella vesiculosa]